jgi:hypothetical protein
MIPTNSRRALLSILDGKRCACFCQKEIRANATKKSKPQKQFFGKPDRVQSAMAAST